MAKIYISLFGCDKNRIDAEIIASILNEAGHSITDDILESDIVVINTCAFIEAATEECISYIMEVIKIKEDRNTPLKKIVVTGCLAERYKKEVTEEFPEVDALVGIGKNSEIISIIERILEGETVENFGEKQNLPINGRRLLSTPSHYAYLKIAEGCSNFCSYCIIPYIRGRYRSRLLHDILDEAKSLVDSGVKEIILVAQDISNYGSDLTEKTNLTRLLKEIVKLENLWKVRLLYTYPEHITNELIDTIAKENKIAKYIDIPLQHSNDKILKNMNRKGTGKEYLDLVKKIKDKIPNISLRSSFIVGYPQETVKQFEELITFIKTTRFARAGCFCYSQEDGTIASKMSGHIKQEEKQRREERFMTIQSAILSELQQNMVGQKLEVIIDCYDEEQKMYSARSEYDAPEIDTIVYVKTDKKLNPGNIITVSVNDTDGIDLFSNF